MGVSRETLAAETKTCSACGEAKPLSQYQKRKGQCNACRAAARRARYRSDPEVRAKAIARAKHHADLRHVSPEHRERWRQYKRTYRWRKGAMSREEKRLLALERQKTALAIKNARQAWRYWLEVLAPDQWMAAYMEALGKPPWHNPRLSRAGAWKVRYHHDETFRQEQLERLAFRKRRRRRLMRGGLTRNEVDCLRKSAKRCKYCGAELERSPELNGRSASIDHVVPLSKGGEHELSNLVAACLSCNSRKQDRSDWHASPIH